MNDISRRDCMTPSTDTPPPDDGTPKATGGARIISILLVGLLSMYLAEVVSGASQVWYIDSWSLTVTFWLYLGHLLFFLNLAVRTRRTSVAQLYLWGCLFALYESWITKVLWAGYFNTPPILGTIAGIAIFEYIQLVFFWHPVMAFVLPILIIEVLMGEYPATTGSKIRSEHTGALNATSTRQGLLGGLIIMVGFIMAANYQYQPAQVVLAAGGTLALIGLGILLNRQPHRVDGFNFNNLILGRTGFAVVTLYMLGINIWGFFVLLPHRLPTTLIPYLMIIGSYLGILLVLKRSPPIIPIPRHPLFAELPKAQSLFTTRKFWQYNLFLLAWVILLCIIYPLPVLLLMLDFYLMFLVALVLFIVVVGTILRSPKQG